MVVGRIQRNIINVSNLLAWLAIITISLTAVNQTYASDEQTSVSLADPFIFGAAGDHNDGSFAVASLDRLAQSGADFYLALGDMSYDNVNPESQWCDLVKAHVGSTFPFELVAGNHEDSNLDGNADGLIENFAECLPNRMGNIVGEYAKEYYFDYPPVDPLARFILISPDLTFSDLQHYTYDIGSPNYNWLAGVIDEARLTGISWVVVGMHKVCLTAGIKSCGISTDLVDLLVSKRVDLVLQGHDHNYQRSKQLTCATAGFYDPTCVADDGSDNLYTKGAGTVFIINGAFGTSLYDINPLDAEAEYFSAWMGANVNPTNGFTKYTVSDTNISVEFVGASGGTFTDTFSIVQSSVTLTPTVTSTPTPLGMTTISSQIGASSDDAEERVSSGSVNMTSSDLELGADNGVDQWVGMRFSGISIPRNAIILNSYVEFEVDEVGSDPTSVLFHGQAADNAPAFVTATYDLSNRARTAAQVAWDDIPAWTVRNEKWQTPDLSPIIQEIVDRPNWTSGNSIVILASGSGRRTAESYDGEPAAAAKLVVVYSTDATPTFTPIPPIATNTPTSTTTYTPTFTPSFTATYTPSNTATFTASASHTPTPTASDTASYTPTFTPTDTPTFTPSFTATYTPSNTATFTATASHTPTPTASNTTTYTLTPTDTPTNTPTYTTTPTSTPTNTATPTPSLNDAVVSGETLLAGTVNGTYLLTQSDDGIAESITERESGGKPQNRYSYLEHKWLINVTPGSVVTLYANAWSSASSDGDTFVFAYSTDDVNYTEMFTVANTSDVGYITFVLPSSTQGSLYVRVTDSDHTTGALSLDTIHMDHLFVRTETVPGTPPDAPSALSAAAVSVNQVNLGWIDNAVDEYGFYIERSLDGINWADLDVAGEDVTVYLDVSVFPNVTYFYRVRAYNGSGDSGYSNVASATTPDGLSLTAVGNKFKGTQTVDLSWTGRNVSAVDIFRDGSRIASGVSGSVYTDNLDIKGGGSYQYQVCEANNLMNCSAIVQVDF